MSTQILPDQVNNFFQLASRQVCGRGVGDVVQHFSRGHLFATIHGNCPEGVKGQPTRGRANDHIAGMAAFVAEHARSFPAVQWVLSLNGVAGQ
jgi:hypothetical protein